MSFTHFMAGSRFSLSTMALRTATAAAMVRQTGSVGRTSIVMYMPPSGLSKLLPMRPRPENCRLANITVPSLAVAAILFASRLVEGDSSRNIMSISDLI